jgi:hypothetical protein
VKPVRTFVGKPGAIIKPVGTGPEQICVDLDAFFNMLNGNIGAENFQPSALVLHAATVDGDDFLDRALAGHKHGQVRQAGITVASGAFSPYIVHNLDNQYPLVVVRCAYAASLFTEDQAVRSSQCKMEFTDATRLRIYNPFGVAVKYNVYIQDC